MPSLGLSPFSNGPFLNRPAERAETLKLARRLNLQPLNLERPLEHFSGGNQQKVLLAKALSREVRLFVFDEPTVGVDVGTRVAIYQFIRDLCEAGAAILLISSDLPEILHLTHRVYVMYRGQLRAELTGGGDHRGQGAALLLRAGGGVMTATSDGQPPRRTPLLWLAHVFVRLGVLPFLLLIAVIVFALMSSRFLAWGNLVNVVRQSSYLTMVAMGQMLALLTGGFDLSVGTIIAITSVVGAMAMTALYTAYPDAVVMSIALGMLAGVGAGVAIGILNGIGVAALGRLALHDDPGHGLHRLRHRAVPHRRRAGLWHAAGIRQGAWASASGWAFPAPIFVTVGADRRSSMSC